MKKLKLLAFSTLSLIMFFMIQSCEEDEVSNVEIDWTTSTTVSAVSFGNSNSFLFDPHVNLWLDSTISVNYSINWGASGVNPVQQADLYVFVKEDVAGTVVTHGGTDGKLIKTVLNLPESGEFSVNLLADNIYQLFKDDFQNSRNTLIESDVIELRWVLSSEKYQLDSRTTCSDCQFVCTIDEVAFIDLSGTYNYVYLESGSYTSGAGNMVTAGYTGSITITNTGLDTYSVDDAELDGSWNGDAVPGDLTIDCNTGYTSISNSHSNAWEFTNFNGSSVDVAWTNAWTAYGESGKVTLTRTDGKDWPTNLKGANQ